MVADHQVWTGQFQLYKTEILEQVTQRVASQQADSLLQLTSLLLVLFPVRGLEMLVVDVLQ